MAEDRMDDGSLGFLGIPADPSAKRFNCETITQQKLINREFWIMDYFEGMHTKFGEDRILVKIKFRIEDGEEDARKFFTNSGDIKYVCKAIKERNAFPRRVTMRANGNRYYVE